MEKKYDKFNFEGFYFNDFKKDVICKLLDTENPLSKEQVLYNMYVNPLVEDIVRLCVNHPSVYLSDLEHFVDDNIIYGKKIPHECIVEEIMCRKEGYGNTRILFHLMDFDKIFNELYNNLGKEIKYSQDFILSIADIYRECNWSVLSQEFACVFGHIKFPEYIENNVLNNESFMSQLDEDATERVLSSIASNIHLSEEFRNKVFDMGCDYNRVKSPTNYMKTQMYLNVAETLFDIEDNMDGINLSYLKVGAYKRLGMMITKGLPVDCEIDIVNRIQLMPSHDSDIKKLLGTLFKHTKNKETLKHIKIFPYPQVKEDAFNNKHIPPYMVLEEGKANITKLCKYIEKYDTINKNIFNKVHEGTRYGCYSMSDYHKLLSYDIFMVNVMLATAKTTPKPILLEMLNTRDESIHHLINANLAMQKNNLLSHQRDGIYKLIEDVKKFNQFVIDKEGSLENYHGPIIENFAQLQTYIKTINDIVETDSFNKNDKQNTVKVLEKYWAVKQRNSTFNVNINTTEHLQNMRNNIIKNTNKNKNDFWVYTHIDKISELVDKIDKELEQRKEKVLEFKENVPEER